MGACRYCGKTAGLFSSEHRECSEKHDQAPGLLARWADEALSGRMPMNVFESRLHTVTSAHYLQPAELRPIVAAAMSKACDRFLQDGLLTDEEEKLLNDVQRTAGITIKALEPKEFVRLWALYGLSRYEYAVLLRDILFQPKEALSERRKLGRFMAESSDFGSPLPFHLASDEFLGNIEDSIVYFKTKTVRRFVGSSQGVSVRLGQGLYYRVGAFQGQPVEDSQLQRLDVGRLAFSNRALYFWGETQRIRLSYEQVLSWEPGNETITLWRDRANSMPEVFRGDAGFGWYMANVIANYRLMDSDVLPGQATPLPLKIQAGS
jgi:hypothetical protein